MISLEDMFKGKGKHFYFRNLTELLQLEHFTIRVVRHYHIIYGNVLLPQTPY